MQQKNILVFPCGSEIGLEIYRSLQYSTHFKLIGGNSTDDHGKFVYPAYIDTIPFIDRADFIPYLKEIVKKYAIDAIYPTMDAVITLLKENETNLGCKIISSPLETVKICLSKTKTYQVLQNVISIPKLYKKEEIDTFPVFSKPAIGYGSRGAKLIENKAMLEAVAKEFPNNLFCQFLPGEEYTIDCFTDKYGKLLFFAPRVRKRIMNGISVNTIPVKKNLNQFQQIVHAINEKIVFQGAWFVQLKQDEKGKLFLLEIAARLGGSSALFRNKGINFAQLTLLDAFNIDVEIIENQYNIELDRALSNKYKLSLDYNEVFIDFNTCLINENSLYNLDLIKFIFQCFNNQIPITLLIKQDEKEINLLEKIHFRTIFNEVISYSNKIEKLSLINNPKAILIDNSFTDRKKVAEIKNIAVFSLDMMESLFQ